MRKKYNFRRILFKILAFVGCVAPLLTLFIIKKDKYFVNQAESVKLSIGAILTLLFAVLILLGKAKNLGGIIWLSIIWGLCYLMKSIINDLLIILPCAIGGLVLYSFFNHSYKINNKKYTIALAATIDESVRQEIKQEKTGVI